MSFEQKLKAMSLELPTPFAYPSPNRRACVRAGSLLYTSGHPPPENYGVTVYGKVGADLDEAEAYRTARAVALMIVASVRGYLGTLDRVRQVVKVVGMVNSAPGFERQFAVIDGASDLFYELFGDECGSHARSAVGMAELPRRFAMEIEAIFELTD